MRSMGAFVFLLLCIGAMEMPKVEDKELTGQQSPRRGRSSARREDPGNRKNSPNNEKTRAPSPSNQKPSSRSSSPSRIERVPSVNNHSPVRLDRVPSLNKQSPVRVDRVPSLKPGLALLGSSNQGPLRSPSSPKHQARERSPSPQKEDKLVRRVSSLNRIKELQNSNNIPKNLFPEPVIPAALDLNKPKKNVPKKTSSKNFFQKAYSQTTNFLGFKNKKKVSQNKKKILGDINTGGKGEEYRKFSVSKLIAALSVGMICIIVAFCIAYLVKKSRDKSGQKSGNNVFAPKRGEINLEDVKKRQKRSANILDPDPKNWCRKVHTKDDPPCDGRRKY